MSIFFWKNLLKCLPSSSSATTTPPPLSFLSDHDHRLLLPPPVHSTSTAVLESNASTMTKNFNSIYDLSSASTSKSLSTAPPSTYSFSFSDSDSDSDSSPPDLAAIVASQRFFFSTPGRSNSITEPSTPAAPDPEPHPSTVDGGIAMKKYSPDPYTDFKMSMEEMIEARNIKDVRSNWGYLHELLSCYLNLNPKHTHKIIISAFSDIIVCLLSSPESAEAAGGRKNSGDIRRLDNGSRW